MEDCIFCKIAKGEVSSKFIYEDEDFFIINDIHPVAKIHYLAIPKKHYARFEQADDNLEVLRKIFVKIGEMKEDLGLKDGYRIIINQGENGNQVVQHLHVHIIGGQKLGPKIDHKGEC